MPPTPAILIEVPMPIRTPWLLIRPKQPGDGAASLAAVTETWEGLHRWMHWAERLEEFTVEQQEVRCRSNIASFLLRDELNFLGIELASGQPVIWCSFYDLDWIARQCNSGYWVRTSAQGNGIATEAANAMVRYPSARLECGESVSRIQTETGLAAASLKSLALPGKEYNEPQTCSRDDEWQIGIAMFAAGLPDLDVTQPGVPMI